MKSGLNPKKHFLIVIGIALLLFTYLETRPKTIIKEEVEALSNNTEQDSPQNQNTHSANPEATKRANEIRKQFATDANPLNVYHALAEMFYETSVFDSSAYYYEEIALHNPGIETWTRAGDAYLQASSLALNGVQIDKMAEKARDAYGKVLKMDPDNLYAKTNTALTFVGSEAPMRAISILRDVLDHNPQYIPAILSMGKLSLQSQQFDKAAERFEEVLKIDAGNVDAKIGLGYSYLETGKTNEGKALLNEVINMDVDPIIKDEVKKTLNNLK